MRVTSEVKEKIRARRLEGVPLSELVVEFGLAKSTMSLLCKGLKLTEEQTAAIEARAKKRRVPQTPEALARAREGNRKGGLFPRKPLTKKQKKHLKEVMWEKAVLVHSEMERVILPVLEAMGHVGLKEEYFDGAILPFCNEQVVIGVAKGYGNLLVSRFAHVSALKDKRKRIAYVDVGQGLAVPRRLTKLNVEVRPFSDLGLDLKSMDGRKGAR